MLRQLIGGGVMSLVLAAGPAAAQQRQLTGTVTAAQSKRPVAEASVVVAGSGGTRTNADGKFTLNVPAGELRKNGVKIKLHTQPFEVLTALLLRHGQVVTREDLQQKLWAQDTFVDFEQGLNKAINKRTATEPMNALLMPFLSGSMTGDDIRGAS